MLRNTSKFFKALYLEHEIIGRTQVLLKNQSILPEKVQEFLPNMVKNNWLVKYADFEGIEKTLSSLDKRTTQHTNLQDAILNLQEGYEEFQEDFKGFFPSVQKFVLEQLENQ